MVIRSLIIICILYESKIHGGKFQEICYLASLLYKSVKLLLYLRSYALLFESLAFEKLISFHPYFASQTRCLSFAKGLRVCTPKVIDKITFMHLISKIRCVLSCIFLPIPLCSRQCTFTPLPLSVNLLFLASLSYAYYLR